MELKARSIEYLGDAMAMHSESGCCTCCFGRDSKPAPITGKVTNAEWRIFLDALLVTTVDGEVHQSAMRPLLRGRVAPRHIPTCYSRAIREGLLSEVRRERSDDVRGRNTNKLEPVYAVAMGVAA